MILPNTYTEVLILMIVSFLCWGSWANTFKLAGKKYRFEFYYLDFALGCLILALIFALTLGSMGFDGFSLLDDLEHSWKRQWLFALAAGILFNFANMLMVAAISVSGMTFGFIITFGGSLIVSSLLAYIIRPEGSLAMTLCGCALLLGAVIAVAIVNSGLMVIRHEALAKAGKTRSTRRPSSLLSVVLALVAGLVMGLFAPLIQKSMASDMGLGPYSVTALFALGLFSSTLVLSLFFMNLPVQGDPVDILQFFRASPKQHLLGVLGGALWCTGWLAALVPVAATVHLDPVSNRLLAAGFPLLAALWGILAWKEFQEGDTRLKFYAVIMFVLFAGGLTLLAAAPFGLGRVPA